MTLSVEMLITGNWSFVTSNVRPVFCDIHEKLRQLSNQLASAPASRYILTLKLHICAKQCISGLQITTKQIIASSGKILYKQSGYKSMVS